MTAVLAFRADVDRERPVWEDRFFQVTPRGLVVKGEAATEADWRALGPKLVQARSSTDWALGDWLLAIEKRYGHTFEMAATITGLAIQTLKSKKSVAAAFEPGCRRSALTFSHHDAVAGLDPAARDRLLDDAEAVRLTREELRDRARQIKETLRAQAEARVEQPVLPGCTTETAATRPKRTTRDVTIRIPEADYDAVMAAVNRIGVRLGTNTISDTILALVRQAGEEHA